MRVHGVCGWCECVCVVCCMCGSVVRVQYCECVVWYVCLCRGMVVCTWCVRCAGVVCHVVVCVCVVGGDVGVSVVVHVVYMCGGLCVWCGARWGGVV